MIYELDTSQPLKLNWSAKGVNRVVQNVWNLINTWQYEVAYNRTMGLEPGILDLPMDKSINKYISEVYRVIADYEPRAQVKEVKFTGIDDEGNMQFKVVVEI